MNFTVIWTEAARDQLATIWMNHPDQKGVTAAAHRIDLLLGRDPANQGEDRPNNRRIMFESPLVVIYRIDAANNQVIVSHCRQY
jgi:plasmid stabilization system protein ParE